MSGSYISQKVLDTAPFTFRCVICHSKMLFLFVSLMRSYVVVRKPYIANQSSHCLSSDISLPSPSNFCYRPLFNKFYSIIYTHLCLFVWLFIYLFIYRQIDHLFLFSSDFSKVVYIKVLYYTYKIWCHPDTESLNMSVYLCSKHYSTLLNSVTRPHVLFSLRKKGDNIRKTQTIS